MENSLGEISADLNLTNQPASFSNYQIGSSCDIGVGGS